MNTFLGIDRNRLIATKSFNTAREIAQQPYAWGEADTELNRHRKRIGEWLGPQLEDARLRIILCGAGSSAFVGQTLAPWLGVRLRRRVEAIASTDLVASPVTYLADKAPTLIVSFSRSGDSPESVASIELANRVGGECRHLVLTCNSDGRLARFAAGNPEMLCLELPERACDRGFAMTASFTSMLVSCAGIFTPDPVQLAGALSTSSFVIENLRGRAHALAQKRFKRLVVLGAGCLSATAREASLKALELTNGGIVSISDTPLGFRHGPKCVIDGATCVVLLVSGSAYTARYDLDLLREIVSDAGAGRIVVVHGRAGPSHPGADGAHGPHPFTPETLARLNESNLTELVSVAPDRIGSSKAPGDDFWLSLPYLVFCQMLAFFWAYELGVTVDDPCPTGEVNRVVQGVTIHPWSD